MNPLNHTQIISKLPSWIYKFFAQIYIDKEFPRHIHIETTTRCNLSCKMCPRPKIDEDMDIRVFTKIIMECAKYAPRSFSLHLFGEPLLDKYLSDKIEYIKAHNKRNNIILTTNGTIVNEKVFDLVDKIIISYRGQDLKSFEPWKNKITIRIFNGVKLDGWRCEHKDYHNYGGNVESTLTPEKIMKAANRFGKSIVGGKFIEALVKKWYPCYHLWLAPAIAWNGDILICCNDPLHKTKLGNIKNMTLHQAWTSRKMNNLRNRQLNGMTQGICSKCNCYTTYKDMWFGWQKK